MKARIGDRTTRRWRNQESDRRLLACAQGFVITRDAEGTIKHVDNARIVVFGTEVTFATAQSALTIPQRSIDSGFCYLG